ncbi:MAG: C39 family peptidase [Chloroflexota bacterium]
MQRNKLILIVLALLVACVVVYFLPPVHSRLAWRLDAAWVQFKRWLNPPEQVVFTPGEQGDADAVATLVQATMQAFQDAATFTPTQAAVTLAALPVQATPTPSQTPLPSETPLPSATPTALPEQVVLAGVVHEYQQFNNCGPANLAMALSFWGWQGDQRDTRAFLRPNLDVDDKNVMPAEMVAYVGQFTALKAVTRVGGDLALLKRLLAAGFPVLVEAGHDPRDDWWMGHYLVINGYDEAQARLLTQDSLSNPDLWVSYEKFANDWRDFNYVFVAIYPTARQDELLGLLGPLAEQTRSYELAAERAQSEIEVLEGRGLYFAWFNLGASLVGLQQYPLAAQAFDSAFELYAKLPEDQREENSRPFRAMWYRVEPYEAYYYTGRYQDVINLANTTFAWVSKAVLEESYYWRGMAYEATGERNRAVADFKKALSLNPNYILAREALERLGEEIP